MPLYEFRCPEGHDFEKFYRSIGTAATEEKCPVCGATASRVMSAAGLVFKGSGFYITDYGKDGKKAEREAAAASPSVKGKSESSTVTDTSTKSDSSTESKAPAPEAPASKSAEPAKAAPVAESKSAKEAAPKSTSPKKA